MIWIILITSYFVFLGLHIAFDALIRWKGYKWFYWHVYLHLPSWKLARRVKFFFSGRRCKKCGDTRRLDVHHKTYKGNRYWEWLMPWTLEVLCRTCHNETHRL